MVHRLALIFGAVGVAGVVALALVLDGSPFAGTAVADNGTAALADVSLSTATDEPTSSPSPRVKTIVDTVFVRPEPTAEPRARATANQTAEPPTEPSFDDRGGSSSVNDGRSGSSGGHDQDDDDDDRSGHGRHGHDDDSDDDHSGRGLSGDDDDSRQGDDD